MGWHEGHACSSSASVVSSLCSQCETEQEWTLVSCTGGGSIPSKVLSELVNVTKIYSNDWAFAVLRSDGTVRAWGEAVC